MAFDPSNTVLLYSPGMEDFAKSTHGYILGMMDNSDRQKFPLTGINFTIFPNRESKPEIPISVRRKHAVVIHGWQGKEEPYSPDEGWMRLYLIDDILRRTASELTYVLPHLTYQRQDRRDKERVPISAKRVLRMLYDFELQRPQTLMTFDAHLLQEEAFAPYPIEMFNTSNLFAEYFKSNMDTSSMIFVGPDAGAADRTRHISKKVNDRAIALIDKRRGSDGTPDVMNIVGDVEDKICVIRDDMLDTGGTAYKGGIALFEHGAKSVYLCITHLLANQDPKSPEPVEEKFRRSGIKVVATDTIPRPKEYIEANSDWLTVLSVTPVTAETIYAHVTGQSLEQWKR